MLVEFALVVVLLFFVLYGIVAYGMAIALRQSMGQATGEAVRAAVVSAAATPAEREAEAEAFAEASTNGLGKPGYGDADATVATCASFAPAATPPPGGQCIEVVFTYDYRGDGAIVPGGPFGVVLPDTLTASAVGRIVP
ncbi:MAG: pilus assembly protein [Actinomycetota bacterium]|nr:pilus assembly protein [Actinomycetota bacterium]